MRQDQNRREFLKRSAVSATALSAGVHTWADAQADESSPNSKLNIGCVGTANRARANINGLQGENIVALCDVDASFAGGAKKSFPDARVYRDFREMIDREKGKIDAVMVGTADHTHAPATAMALRNGMHTYCEKPLTHTIEEAQLIAKLTKETGLATQHGTQIHAGKNYRRVVEIIQSGAIGEIYEVHVWVGKGWGGSRGEVVPQDPPASLDWDLWLGPAPERDFAPGQYHPAEWRRWWDFGNGTLGDMGCHYMDLPFWALGLGTPVACEAHGPEVDTQLCPVGLIVDYVYPNSKLSNSPVQLRWYDGNLTPKEVAGHAVRNSGVMFVGDQGEMFADYGSYKLYPEDKFSKFEAPAETIPASIGHHAEWIKACKDGSETTCDFVYAANLTESVLLGTVAYRTGKSLKWNSENLEAEGCPEAKPFVSKEYRDSWKFI